MDAKLLIGLVLYYTFISAMFFYMSPYLEDATNTANLSQITAPSYLNSTGSGSAADIASTAGSFFLFLGFGIGLPSSTPGWVQFLFTSWTIIINIVTLIFVINFVLEILNALPIP